MSRLSLSEARAWSVEPWEASARSWSGLCGGYVEAGVFAGKSIMETRGGWEGLAGSAFRAKCERLIEELRPAEKRARRLAAVTRWYGVAMAAACLDAVGFADEIGRRGFVVSDSWEVSPAHSEGVDSVLKAAEGWLLQWQLGSRTDQFAWVDERAEAGMDLSVAWSDESSPTRPQSVAGYLLGPPPPRELGFDDDFPYGSKADRRSVGDYLTWAQWWATNFAATELLPYNDDAWEFHRRYLFGSGVHGTFDYEEAFREDSKIRTLVQDELRRAASAANSFVNDGRRDFEFSSETRANGQPATDNWRKTIGAHYMWSENKVSVVGDVVTMDITIRAHDRYNFNAGAHDVSSGIPDNQNGELAAVGLARGFDSTGELHRRISWRLGELPPKDEGFEGPPSPNRPQGHTGGVAEGGYRGNYDEAPAKSRMNHPRDDSAPLQPPTRK